MSEDQTHHVNSLKRLGDGTWQLWCRCGSVFTADTVVRVTNLHGDHTISKHHKESYGVDK